MRNTLTRYLGAAILLLLSMPPGLGAGVTSPSSPLSEPPKGKFSVLNNQPGDDEPLPPEIAFPFLAEATNATTLTANWNITPGYYLYRDKIHLRLVNAPSGVSLDAIVLPPSDTKKDDDLGVVEVYHTPLAIRLPLQRPPGGALTVTLEAKFQGCAENRLCYPPQTRSIALTLPPFTPDQGNSAPQTTPLVGTVPSLATDSEQDRITAFLANGNQLLVLAWFFGIGLLLAFTPCIFPMFPILSSIIVGQGKDLTTARAFSLSLVYVIAMAATYTTAGVVAGLVGTNLQILFQDPWIIGAFSAVFVALALSMFGLFELQLPLQLQNHITTLSNHQTGGTYVGVAVMGFLSALVVGPCIAPPLAGTLLYISQSGNAVQGGLALFSMSIGMGIPLLVIGTTGGRWLPKAGAWMDAIKAIFGVLLLTVALTLLERILPASVTLPLWTTLFIVCGTYLGALDALPLGAASGWRRLWKGFGVVLLVQGVLILVGAASGSDDPWQPLKCLRMNPPFSSAHSSDTIDTDTAGTLSFQRIASPLELDQALASAESHPVLLDFYADWCVECKRMEQVTFSDAAVRAALSEVILLRADVTKNTEADQALLRRFELFGPPALLFFDANGKERRDARIIGFADAAQLRAHLEH